MAEKKAILLRVSADLADALQRWAADELRSVNSQIEYVLREAVRKRFGERTAARPDQPQPMLRDVAPAVQEVEDALRNHGFPEWADRLAEALRGARAEGPAIAGVQTILRALHTATPTLPIKLRSAVSALLATLDRPAAHGGATEP